MPYCLPIECSRFQKDIKENRGREIAAFLEGLPCDRCGERALKLTRSRLSRQVVGLKRCEEVQIPLSRCGNCGCRRRVLPLEVLPRKTFSLPVIAECARTALEPRGTLRAAVSALDHGAVRPHFSTLHGWLGGLGERAFDQVKLGTHAATVGGSPALSRFSALLRQAQKQMSAAPRTSPRISGVFFPPLSPGSLPFSFAISFEVVGRE